VRRYLSVFLVLCVLFASVAAAATTQPSTGTGTATTGVDLVSADLTAGLLGDLSARLGGVELDATSVDALRAVLDVEAVRIGDQVAAGQQISTDDGDDAGSLRLPVDLGAASAAVNLVDYLVAAGDGTAVASLDALAAELTAGPLQLSVSALDGAGSEVTPDSAASGVGLRVEGLELTLGDLLPDELLEGLPLSAVLDLLGQLDLTLPADLQDALDLLQSLISLLATVDGVLAELDALIDELGQVLAGDELVQALVDAVEDAEDALVDALADHAAAAAVVEEATAALTAAQATAEATAAALATANAEVTTAQATVDAIEVEIAELEAELLTLDPVLDMQRITEIDAELASLQTQLTAAEQELATAQTDAATAQTTHDAALADVTTAETTLAAAEATLAAADDAVDEARRLLAEARAALRAAVEDLAGDNQLIADLLDAIDVLEARLLDLLEPLLDLLDGLPDLDSLLADLLGLLEDAELLSVGRLDLGVATLADAEGGDASATCTASGVTLLGTTLPTPTCADLTDAFAQISTAVSGVLAALPGVAPTVSVAGLSGATSEDTDDDGLSTATASITPLRLQIASASLDGVLDSLVADMVASLEDLLALSLDLDSDLGLDIGSTLDLSAIEGDLTRLIAELGALPTGLDLDGLSTLGLDLRVAGLTSTASFLPASDDSPDVVTGPPTTTPTTGAQPTPGLARTGGSSSLLLALGLLLMVTGGHAFAATRRDAAPWWRPAI
jgi:predicted  nucleic acid-binding Zn-ribbon protein